ncbi:MAG: transcription termination/antitermination protein NusG [Prevotellaceae bacterium]|nr:transcription termination/antitermination protein NusG [Prevotellaceae bacterium]
MTEINEKKWYVLRAITGKENRVKEYIELDVKNNQLERFVSQILIPTEKVFHIRGGKKITKERNCMPGYVLVEAILNNEIQHRLRWTPNVLGFLSESNGVPSPVRLSEVNRILGQVDEMQEAGEEMLLPYHEGETVKVIFGPFSGFTGTIEEVNNEKKKLKVMVMIFGRKNPIELSFTQVEKE